VELRPKSSKEKEISGFLNERSLMTVIKELHETSESCQKIVYFYDSKEMSGNGAG
jgi:hypothetical protein